MLGNVPDVGGTERPPALSSPFADLAGLTPQMSLEEALDRLRRSPLPALPVIDPDTGELAGMLSRGDSPPESIPPLRLGGMATPLGVYLTDGTHAGGAGFWGLMLTGMVLCVLSLAAQAITQVGLHSLSLAPRRLLEYGGFQNLFEAPALHGFFAAIGPLLPMPLIFLLLRFLPMAGTHAAEHQVVHCIERRAPLTPVCVRTMPRAHPRCGTNIAVGFSLFLLLFLGAFCALQAAAFPPADSAALAAALAAPLTLMSWRRLGRFVQQWLATRPATEAQILGAIRAAEQVLARRRANPWPAARWGLLRRYWRMGIVQVLIGYFALFGPLSLAAHYWPWLQRFVGL